MKETGKLTVIEIGNIRDGKHDLPLVRLQGKRHSRTPRWWNAIIRRQYHDVQPWWSWFDHHGRDGETLIVEPYGVSSDDIREIVDLCAKHNLDFRIDAESEHYPTRTICIRIWQSGATQ